MEPESKNSNDVFVFDNELFDQVDLDIVSEKVENNISILLANDRYRNVDEKLLDLNMKLNSFLGETEQDLFDKYIALNSDAISYQNCLAYYLGLKAGLTMRQLE